jgi:hypothetical protein
MEEKNIFFLINYIQEVESRLFFEKKKERKNDMRCEERRILERASESEKKKVFSTRSSEILDKMKNEDSFMLRE